MKYLSLALLFLCGCSTTNITKLAEQLKDDPATIDVQIQTIYGSMTFHRSFPTNWTPPLKR
jgi:hypothetical protein